MIYGLVGRVRFLVEEREFSIFLNIQTGSEAHPMGAGDNFSGGKGTGA
jgi:hypothetical protein